MGNFTANEKFISNEVKSVLTTKKSIIDYVTLDTSLVGFEGDTKRITTRSVTGEVEKVTEGNGNTGDIEVTGVSRDYTIGMYQGRFPYTDEQVGRDGYAKVVGTGVAGMGEKMANAIKKDIVAEWNKTKNTVASSSFTFDNFADAVAAMNIEDEENYKLYGFINPKGVAKLRKALKDDLKYVEAFARTGYIGTVCNVDIITSKIVADDVCHIVDKSAVTLFLKDCVDSEEERVPNTRKTNVYSRWTGVPALMDDAKASKIAPAVTTPTITTATVTHGTDVSLAGACAGADVLDVLVNDKVVAHGTISSGAYTATIPTCVAGDIVTVKAYADNKAGAESTAKTVA